MNHVYRQSRDNKYSPKLAQAYVPYQQYHNLYNVNEALYKGTIFKDLYQEYKSPYPFKS
ncbi:spore coat associated protein CotJA [Mycoplasmatota bacterium]|nr:spore coat associated protein CotJA [Mycoplasmatota bacterium]